MVGVAVALRERVIGTQRRAQRLALFLQAEGQDGGVAAEKRRARAALEIVGHHDPLAGGLRDVDMAVDTAGQDVAAGGVDLLRPARQRLADLDDPPVAHTEIGREDIRSRGDRAAANDEVEALVHRAGSRAATRRSTSASVL